MSGVSGDEPCPRCGATMQTYDDWRPFTMHEATCLTCGLHIYTGVEILNKEQLEMARQEYNEGIDETPVYAEVDAGRKEIKEFDGNWLSWFKA